MAMTKTEMEVFATKMELEKVGKGTKQKCCEHKKPCSWRDREGFLFCSDCLEDFRETAEQEGI